MPVMRYDKGMSSNRAILRTALDLPVEERAELALRLVESLDGEPAGDVEVPWAAEVEDRVDALRRGETRTYPAADVFREQVDGASQVIKLLEVAIAR